MEEELYPECPLCDQPILPGELAYRLQKTNPETLEAEYFDDGDEEKLIHHRCMPEDLAEALVGEEYYSSLGLQVCPECMRIVDECPFCGTNLN